MTLNEFQKKKEFLICVDSDGCAMDTMDIKHIRCFGPCMVKEWSLDTWKDQILRRWNEINLYTMTRGINRFQGLLTALEEINESITSVDDLKSLKDWVGTAKELSNDSLTAAVKETGSECLRKALSWSEAVNCEIMLLPESEKKPFDGVKDALAYAHQHADIAIVSSANLQAVLEEWEMYGLLNHTDIVLAQDAGTKAFCIGELVKKGYEKDHVMMTGDAPGDLAAAEKNGVLFYPIQVRKEGQSWQEFQEKAVEKLLDGSYAGAYQEEKIGEFKENLSK